MWPFQPSNVWVAYTRLFSSILPSFKFFLGSNFPKFPQERLDASSGVRGVIILPSFTCGWNKSRVVHVFEKFTPLVVECAASGFFGVQRRVEQILNDIYPRPRCGEHGSESAGVRGDVGGGEHINFSTMEKVKKVKMCYSFISFVILVF